MTLANKRVQVVRPVYENSLSIGIVGIAIPAATTVVAGRYVLVPENATDLEKVQGLLFSEAELEPLP